MIRKETSFTRLTPLATIAKSISILLVSLVLFSCDENTSSASGLPTEIKNTSFDSANNGVPTNWFIDQKVKDKGIIETIQQGSNSLLRLTPNSNNSGNDLLGVGQMLDATRYRGHTLKVSAKLGARDGANAVIGVHVLGDGDEFEYVQFNQENTDAKLVEQSDSLYVSEKAKNIIVYAIVSSTEGAAFFDDIKFISDQKGVTTRPVSSGSSTAKVVINTYQIVRKVPSEILGTNVEWIFDGQGLWSEKDKEVSTQATQLAKQTGFKLLRFPGGVFSDYYNWKDGIGPRGKRAKTAHHPDGPLSVHNFGTDELISFANDIDSDMLITVNVGHGTAEMAADWVEYLNRQKNENVLWWEIGNELYMDGDLSGAEISAKEYAARFKKFAKAMKSVDPNIKLGAIGGINYGRYSFIKDSDWTEDILDRVAEDVDFLAVHNAYAPVLMGGGENADPVDVYQTMLAAPLNIADNLKTLDKMLEDYDNDKRQIKIAVTEWGPFFHVLPSSKWVDHIKTLGSSLFVGSTLNTFLRHPRLEIANAFKITDHGFMGWIGNADGEFRATVLAEVFSLYEDAIGGNVVLTDVNSDTYDARSLGVINAVDDVPYLDVLSVNKGSKLIVYVVNKHFQQAISTELTIQSKHTFSDFTSTIVSGKSLDAHTGTELPVIPGLKWAKQVNIERFENGAKNEISIKQNNGDIGANSNKNGEQILIIEFEPMSVTRLVLSQ